MIIIIAHNHHQQQQHHLSINLSSISSSSSSTNRIIKSQNISESMWVLVSLSSSLSLKCSLISLLYSPPLGCNGSAWKRVVRIGNSTEYFYDSDDDDDNNSYNDSNNSDIS